MTQIITVPNPLLRQKSEPVKQIDARIQRLIQELKKALVETKDPPGIGLSAVQINKPIRIFLARENIQAKPQVFINPAITWKSKELTDGVPRQSADKADPLSATSPEPQASFEGCLSVPEYHGLVQRHQKIRLKYYTLDAKSSSALSSLPKGYTLRKKTQVFSGLLATVIQHELDHLNGILFIDRVLEQNNQLYKLEDDQFVETTL